MPPSTVIQGVVVTGGLLGALMLVYYTSIVQVYPDSLLDPNGVGNSPYGSSPMDAMDSMVLVKLNSTYIQRYNAYCMDGSAPSFYMANNTQRGGNPANWVIYQEGGGACYDPVSCSQRADSYLGSSSALAHYTVATALVSSNCGTNPVFCNFTHIFINYCSSDFYSGQQMASHATWGYYFTGHNILTAILNYLIDTKGLGSARQVLYGGISAGGLGVLYNADYVSDLLKAHNPNVYFRVFAQSAWYFPDVLPYPYWNQQANAGDTASISSSFQALMGLYNAFLDQSCSHAFAHQTANLWQCLSANSLFPYISSPIFVVENMFDQNQIGYLSAVSTASNYNAYVQYFGTQMNLSLSQVAASIAAGSPNALMVYPCFTHIVNMGMLPYPVVAGTTFSAQISLWFLSSVPSTKFVFYDSCSTLNCNPTCFAPPVPVAQSSSSTAAGMGAAPSSSLYDSDFLSDGVWFDDARSPSSSSKSSPATASFDQMSLQVLDSSYTTQYSAYCMDGTPAAYYLNIPAAPTNNWVINLEGGGSCSSMDSCESYGQSHTGSSSTLAAERPADDLWSNNCTINPSFCDFNHVVVHYCSGDFWTGQLSAPDADIGYYFSGHNILNGVLHKLLDTMNFGSAQQVLLSGEESGGLGVMQHADWITELLQAFNPELKATSRGGWYFPQAHTYYCWNSSVICDPLPLPAQLQHVLPLYDAFVDESCAISKPASDLWQCLTVTKLFQYVSTPTYVVQNMFDSNEVPTSLATSRDLYYLQILDVMAAPATAPNFGLYLQYFGDEMNSSFVPVISSIRNGSGNAVFLPACFQSVDNIGLFSYPVVNGHTYADTLGPWYFNSESEQQFTFVDSCTGVNCNPTCHAGQSASMVSAKPPVKAASSSTSSYASGTAPLTASASTSASHSHSSSAFGSTSASHSHSSSTVHASTTGPPSTSHPSRSTTAASTTRSLAASSNTRTASTMSTLSATALHNPHLVSSSSSVSHTPSGRTSQLTSSSSVTARSPTSHVNVFASSSTTGKSTPHSSTGVASTSLPKPATLSGLGAHTSSQMPSADVGRLSSGHSSHGALANSLAASSRSSTGAAHARGALASTAEMVMAQQQPLGGDMYSVFMTGLIVIGASVVGGFVLSIVGGIVMRQCCNQRARYAAVESESSRHSSLSLSSEEGSRPNSEPPSREPSRNSQQPSQEPSFNSLCSDRSVTRGVEGKLVRVIGRGSGAADSQLSYPSALCLSAQNEVFVGDRNNHRIQMFDVATGAFLRQWGSEGTAIGQLYCPSGLALDYQSCELFVTDNSDRVQVFDLQGRFLRQWGRHGSGPGEFDSPRGLVLGPEPQHRVYVCDSNNHRVQVFDRNGVFLRQFGGPGSGDGQFLSPNALCFDSERNLYVLDDGTGVQVFDEDGRFFRKWGTHGTQDGEFENARGIAVDSLDRVFLCDVPKNLASSRGQMFDRDGRFLFKVSATELPSPCCVAFSPSGPMLVGDADLNHVCVFE